MECENGSTILPALGFIMREQLHFKKLFLCPERLITIGPLLKFN